MRAVNKKQKVLKRKCSRYLISLYQNVEIRSSLILYDIKRKRKTKFEFGVLFCDIVILRG